MEEDGRGWSRMEEDGVGWKRMKEDGVEGCWHLYEDKDASQESQHKSVVIDQGLQLGETAL